MILAGLQYKEGNLVMETRAYRLYDYCRLEEAEDIHEAAHTVWRYFHPRHILTVREYVKAEMHDTETRKTWTVDRNGHSQRDYHSESECDFRSRYAKP